MQPDSIPNWPLERLRDRLPILNAAIRRGEADHGVLREPIAAALDDASRRIDALDQSAARATLLVLGFLISSYARHATDQGEAPGAPLRDFPSAEPTLLALATIANHPPRDSFATFALWNDDPVFTFTGSIYEKMFINSLRAVTASLEGAVEILRLLARIQGALDDRSAPARLAEARAQVEEARTPFETLRESKRPGIASFFVDELRHYNGDWGPIGGRVYGAPSGGDCVPWIALDYLLGTVQPWYGSYVDRRSPNFPGEMAASLERDRSGPSLIDAIASGLGLDEDSLGLIGASDLAERIEEKPLRWLRTIDAYLHLVAEAVALSGLHAGFLKGWILKGGVAVGTSGMEVRGALKILEMRRSDPRLKLLKEALALVKSSVVGTAR